MEINGPMKTNELCARLSGIPRFRALHDRPRQNWLVETRCSALDSRSGSNLRLRPLRVGAMLNQNPKMGIRLKRS